MGGSLSSLRSRVLKCGWGSGRWIDGGAGGRAGSSDSRGACAFGSKCSM